MNEIIEKIESLLEAYGIENSDGIAYDLSAAFPWRYIDGTEKYDDLFDLMNIALELKCPTIKCVVGQEIIDVSFRSIFIEGVKGYLKKVLGKTDTKNMNYYIILLRIPVPLEGGPTIRLKSFSLWKTVYRYG